MAGYNWWFNFYYYFSNFFDNLIYLPESILLKEVIIMNMMEIVKDAVRYPFSDWKKFLIYGLIIMIFNMFHIVRSLNVTNIDLILLSEIIRSIFVFLLFGYFIRIIKSSLAGNAKLPEFNTWFELFTDGIKLVLVNIVYMLPIISILFVFTTISNFEIITNGLNPLSLLRLHADYGMNIWFFIASIYIIIISPIWMMAIGNMAYNNGELRAAFKFYEIFNKIRNIGWINLIVWYLIFGILFYFIITSIGNIIQIIFIFIHITVIGGLLISLSFAPYLYIYLARFDIFTLQFKINMRSESVNKRD